MIYYIELMRLLGGQQVELETYRMRNGSILVLTEEKKGDRFEVAIYDKADIGQALWQFFFRDDAMKKFHQLKTDDQSPIDPSGAKR
jgi:hypothetical protein